MIQAPLPKPIELPKARPPKAERTEASSNVKVVRNNSLKPSEKSTKEIQGKEKAAKEFSDELESAQGNVKPVAISPDQEIELPSSLVQPASTIETSSPKVFDPSLTKSVEELIQPKTTEVDPTNVEVLDAEFALANDPQLTEALAKRNIGRSPSIDFAKAEIDPQLLSNEDFVAQKNLVAKKPVAPNAYGMKVVPADAKAAAELELKQSQVVKEAGLLEAPVNSQQFILGLQAEKSLSASESQSAQKVFDLSNIKSSQPNEIMNQITDYVVQARAAKEPTVNLRVNHDELGMIDITVSRASHDAIAVNIGAHSFDGKAFFQENSKDLFTHLTSAGLNVADLKVETPSQTAKNDFDLNSQSGKNQQGAEKQFGSEQNQRRHDADRRQDLWKLLNKEAA